MRKLASIQRISGIRPIPGADAIEAADVLGWTVVVKKGDFQAGDLIVYFEVDSWLDASNPAFATFEERFSNWGTKRGMRLKTIKLRKQLSQGLVLSIDSFAEFLNPKRTAEGGGLMEGDDVTEVLKIEKWEALEEAKSNAGGKVTPASRTRAFPWFIRKTDQERVQNYIGLLANVGEDETFEATIKLDGSSMTVYCVGRNNPYYEEILKEQNLRRLRGKSFAAKLWLKLKAFFQKEEKPDFLTGVCSRNIELDIDGANHFSQFVRDHNVIEKLQRGCMSTEALAFQGELIAPSIQENYEKVNGYQWHVFDVFDITTQTYFRPGIARTLTEVVDLSYAPVLSIGLNLRQFDNLADPTPRAKVENILTFAEGPGMNPA